MKKTSPGSLGPTSPSLGRFSFAFAAHLFSFLCGAGAPASAQGEQSVLQGRIDTAADILKHEPRLSALSDARRRATVQFVIGNLLFVLLHEVGHVMITEMGLPVIGREEDAADSYAAVMMLAMKNQFSDQVLAAATKGWFYSDRRDRKEKTPVAFYDSHGISQQRAYQILCFMVGSDPEKFAALADEADMPDHRQETCRGDFSNADWSWTQLLKDHRRTTQPKTEISVRYDEIAAASDIFARVMKCIELLEIVAQRLSDKYAWRAPFSMHAKACGRPRADWNLATRTLTICYELAEDFARLYAAYGSDVALTRR